MLNNNPKEDFSGVRLLVKWSLAFEYVIVNSDVKMSLKLYMHIYTRLMCSAVFGG